MESDHWLVRKQEERGRIAARISDVIGCGRGRYLKMEISENKCFVGGQTGQRWLAGPGKCPEKVVAAAKTDTKNVVTDGDRRGIGGNHWYRQIGSHEVVMVVLIWWSGARWRHSGGEPKCRQHMGCNSENVGQNLLK